MSDNVKGGAAQRADEIFDVVDEHDQVVAQETRAEVHRLKLRHRAVHVLVCDRQGRVFLQRRSMLKDSAPGKWCASCSGHVDAGEDYDHAAARELAEEIGLVVSLGQPRRVLRLEARAETGWEFLWIYEIEHAGPFALNPAEIMDGRWWTRAEIDEAVRERPRDLAGAFRYLWAQLKRH
jgi:isopentenyl-diphosphate Delta-isomerase